jgi:GNAT superfamily N-acetyltransferase
MRSYARSPARRFDRLKLQLRHLGLTKVISALRTRLTPQPYRLYIKSLETFSAGPALSPEITIRSDAAGELALRREEHRDLPMPFFHDLSDGWRTCCLALQYDDPVGIVWVTADSPFVCLAEREHAVVGLYTCASARNLGVAKFLVAAACQLLRQRGFIHACATVHEANLPSQRVFEALGFEVCGHRLIRGLRSRRRTPAEWSAPRLSHGFAGAGRVVPPRARR